MDPSSHPIAPPPAGIRGARRRQALRLALSGGLGLVMAAVALIGLAVNTPRKPEAPPTAPTLARQTPAAAVSAPSPPAPPAVVPQAPAPKEAVPGRSDFYRALSQDFAKAAADDGAPPIKLKRLP